MTFFQLDKQSQNMGQKWERWVLGLSYTCDEFYVCCRNLVRGGESTSDFVNPVNLFTIHFDT